MIHSITKRIAKPIPGLRNIDNLIATAFAPLGTTLYIYGGGWNQEDNGASKEARTVGVSPEWKQFFEEQNVGYKYRDDSNLNSSFYPYDGRNRYSHLGLDCSGYMGWVIYNVMNTESGNAGYVVEASKGARTFAEKYGLGTWSRETGPDGLLDVKAFKTGDIISIDGHIWMYLGSCEDGSILLIHSSVTKSRTGADGGGVQLSVLNPLGDDRKDCQAYRLADNYMKRHFPEWYKRYEVVIKPYHTYLKVSEKNKNTGRFSWNPQTMADLEGYRFLPAEEILAGLT